MPQKDMSKNQQNAPIGFMDRLHEMIFEQSPASKDSGASATNAAPATPVQTHSGIVNEGMVKEITALVMGKTTAYTALVEAIIPLEGYIPDEANRYRAAFALVGKTRTVEQIVQSIDLHHIGALDAEIQRFLDQAKNEDTSQIQTRAAQAKDLRQKALQNTNLIDEVRKQADIRIKEIMKESADSELLARDLESQISAQRGRLTEVQRNFDSATSVVRQRLLVARSNVLQFLSSSS